MVEKWIMNRLSRRMRWIYRTLDTPPILDLDTVFPAHHALTALYPALRAEALAVFQGNPQIPRFHDLSPTQRRISASDGKNWRMFMVKSYRHLIRANAAQMPVLARFLKAHPQVTTAAISWLDPGKHIPRHRGPFRGILRYHLCLHAPDCGTDAGPWLEVDGQRIPYAEGAGLLWDDTFTHEVLNPGPNPRIALLLDVRRPVTRPLHRALFRLVMAGGRTYSWLHEKRFSARAPKTPGR